jgi:NAD-dependent dihydropyrimidine dehydrogenase PreA subunit
MKSYYIKNVTTLSLDSSKCIGCKKCLEVCPHGVFIMNGKKAEIYNKNLCMECGACMKNCPSKAIKVEPGVGCAAALLFAAINKTAPSCGCSGKSKKTSCCG